MEAFPRLSGHSRPCLPAAVPGAALRHLAWHILSVMEPLTPFKGHSGHLSLSRRLSPDK